jgi:glycosyltransferase involved in cell wall biosynthesis
MIRSVSILIPTHNRAEILEQTLDSLIALRLPSSIDVDLLVVANACKDSTVDVCHASFPRLPLPARCVEEPQPGLSIARNRAVAETTGEICAFVDDDVCVSPQWLEAMIATYNHYPADIVGGKVELWWAVVQRPDWLDPDLEGFLSRLDHGTEVVEIFAPKNIVGANFSFKRQVYEVTGPFRADLGRIGMDLLSTEETEFCDRAVKQGARIFYSPEMQLKHWVAPQRVTVEYLMGVSRGFTRGRLRAKPYFGPKQFIRSFFGNIYRVVRYEITRWYAKLRSDRMLEVASLVRRAGAEAGIATSVRRVLSYWK